ncbi:MAG: hypothetical protein IPM85_00500 [Chitinophagaceae bacterium]|nr:hypothetical protein [Chitinophagaceae bacterium]
MAGMHNEFEVSCLGLDDYSKFIKELRYSLLNFSKENNDSEIAEKALTLSVSENSDYSILNTILLFLEAKKNNE